MGNAFLHHISTVQVIIQVVRAFTDMDIEVGPWKTLHPHSICHAPPPHCSFPLPCLFGARAFDQHVEGTVNPVRDMDIITQELLAKDIERFTSRIEKLAGKKTRAYQGAAKEKEVRLWVAAGCPLCVWCPPSLSTSHIPLSLPVHAARG